MQLANADIKYKGEFLNVLFWPKRLLEMFCIAVKLAMNHGNLRHRQVNDQLDDHRLPRN